MLSSNSKIFKYYAGQIWMEVRSSVGNLVPKNIESIIFIITRHLPSIYLDQELVSPVKFSK